MNRHEIDAGFEHVRAQRVLRESAGAMRRAGFWRALNPELTISDEPLNPLAAALPVDPAVVETAKRQLLDEGYFQTPPLVPPARFGALRLAAERIVAAGLPSGFVCVYDEFYQLFDGLQALFAPIVGGEYLLVLQGLWTYFVPAGDAAYRRWTTVAPHRDTLGPDPRVVRGESPSIVNVWIPLTDVSTLDSCIYVVPAPGDPHYHSRERGVRPADFRLQDVRALPAQAGSVLGWSTHLVHWGSRSSRFAGQPRVAATVYFQRRDVAPLHASSTVEMGARLPFERRLEWIAGSIGIGDLWDRAGIQHA